MTYHSFGWGYEYGKFEELFKFDPFQPWAYQKGGWGCSRGSEKNYLIISKKILEILFPAFNCTP